MAAIVAALAGGAGAVELDQRQAVLVPPVNDAPRWHTVLGEPGTNQPVLARSITTGQPVAYLPPGYKFLSFGANSQIITLAMAGQVAYIPATAASEMYPVAERAMEWKAAGPTLEEQAEIARQKAKEAQAKGLEPLSFKKRAEERKAMEAMGQMGMMQGQYPGQYPGQYYGQSAGPYFGAPTLGAAGGK